MAAYTPFTKVFTSFDLGVTPLVNIKANKFNFSQNTTSVSVDVKGKKLTSSTSAYT